MSCEWDNAVDAYDSSDDIMGDDDDMMSGGVFSTEMFETNLRIKGEERVEEDAAKPPACSICFEDLVKTTTRGVIDSCDHLFCYECISEWSLRENTCPCCKKRFKSIEKEAMTPSEKKKRRRVRKRSQKNSPSYQISQVEDHNDVSVPSRSRRRRRSRRPITIISESAQRPRRVRSNAAASRARALRRSRRAAARERENGTIVDLSDSAGTISDFTPDQSFWACVTCTFHNSMQRTDCEMCGATPDITFSTRQTRPRAGTTSRRRARTRPSQSQEDARSMNTATTTSRRRCRDHANATVGRTRPSAAHVETVASVSHDIETEESTVASQRTSVIHENTKENNDPPTRRKLPSSSAFVWMRSSSTGQWIRGRRRRNRGQHLKHVTPSSTSTRPSCEASSRSPSEKPTEEKQPGPRSSPLNRISDVLKSMGNLISEVSMSISQHNTDV